MSGGIDMGDQDITNAERVEADTFYIGAVDPDSLLMSKDYIDGHLRIDSTWLVPFVDIGGEEGGKTGDSIRLLHPGTYNYDYDIDSTGGFMVWVNYGGGAASDDLFDTSLAIGFLDQPGIYGDSCVSLIIEHEETNNDSNFCYIGDLTLFVGGDSIWAATQEFSTVTRTTSTIAVNKPGFIRGKPVLLKVEVKLDNQQEARIYAAHLLIL